MITALRLPLHFDPRRLAEDLGRINEEEWVSHFVKSNYEGDWSGVALRSTSGEARQLYPDPSKSEFRDTELVQRVPYFHRVMQSFECPLLAVRLLRLAPGSRILEHRDHCLSIEDGECRVHVPVQTSPEVIFLLAGERIPLQVGSCWYLNVNHRHSVENRGVQHRVHLVLDCMVNDWVREMIVDARVEAYRKSLTAEGARRLQVLEDGTEFVAAISAASGIPEQDVQGAIGRSKREWARRTI